MWYRIVLNKDYSVSSCTQVESSVKEAGKSVHYIEADSKESAIKILLDRYDAINKRNALTQKARREKLTSQGICTWCGKNPQSLGFRNCQICRDKNKQNKIERKQGRPPTFVRAKTDEEKVNKEISRRERDVKKGLKKAASNYIQRRALLAKVLEQFDSMNAGSFRTWLIEELNKAQQKEMLSAAKRSARFANKVAA